MEDFLQYDFASLIDRIGADPFHAMWYLFINGGWAIFVYLFGWMALMYWQGSRQAIFNSKKQWVILAIHIPKLHEQSPRAIENMFAYLAGAHSSNSWTEDWIVGRTQDTISCEIVSIEGHIQFVIRTTRGLRDLAEAAIYSQYPDADITEIEDYTTKVPQHYPDEEWDLWGTQFVPTKSDVYPLKTYPFFEDKVSGEFKDPLSAFLESMSRIGPGEQVWYQILLIPIAQKDFPAKASLMVKKLTGQKIPVKKSFAEHAADIPLNALSFAVNTAFGSAPAAPKKPEGGEKSNMMHMTDVEKQIVTGIETKASKIVYLCKLRMVYVAKKAVMSKARVANPIVGAIKQFNTNNMQSLKPDLKSVGMSGALWFFKNSRNNGRKNALLSAYKNRSGWAGLPPMHLCTEELATLWHFPHSEQVKAPQIRKTENKKTEPPANLPFG